MPALFAGVMQRAISAGSERVAGQLAARKDNTEQRGEGKQSQKHLFRQLGLLRSDEGRRLMAAIDQTGLITQSGFHCGSTNEFCSEFLLLSHRKLCTTRKSMIFKDVLLCSVFGNAGKSKALSSQSSTLPLTHHTPPFSEL